MESNNKKQISRRDFLKTAGVAGVAAPAREKMQRTGPATNWPQVAGR